jgi:hypothetical protein
LGAWQQSIAFRALEEEEEEHSQIVYLFLLGLDSLIGPDGLVAISSLSPIYNPNFSFMGVTRKK